ncbi:M16 family metallopeptidase [Wenyingzhuangia sp. IMCC45467]
MKTIISCLLILAVTIHVNSQDLTKTLPIDESIKKGVLPNGMTYYIKSTNVLKEAASYYIIQNVGSILENENQRGLAHFLEHMAFNGTAHFPGKGILNTLQKHGAVFGKDINAYTSFDETVYNLNNIPTKDNLIDTCLMVLHDWSNYLLLTDEEIDAERGVIKEEWRTRQSGQMRLYKNSMPITYNYSKYADRMPIGLMSVVEGFKYGALRSFYHDWYRTDLQAIVVIGDVDVTEVEQKIIDKFSKIPAVENPRERKYITILDNEKMMYSFGEDPEVSSAAISFGIRHKRSLETETVEDLKQSLLENMVVSMLSSRITEKAQKPEAHFLGASVRYGELMLTSNYFGVYTVPKPNKQKEAFAEVMTELMRAVKFGFTQSEMDRAITVIKSSYENQIAKKNDKSHKSIERIIQNNYLSNRTMTDIQKEYEISKQILENINMQEVHQTLKELYTQKNRYINVTGVEGQDNLTENQANNIITSVENNQALQPYTEALDGKTLLSEVEITPGKIVKTTIDNNIGATTFVLSNGIKVHYKFVNKQKDKVSLQALSYGGTSLLKDKDLPSASLVSALLSRSGLVNFTAVDLKKILAGKTARVDLSLGDVSEAMHGSSNTKDVETMLQMVHAYFVKPRFDEDAFKVLQSNIDNYLMRRSKDIGEKMKDSLTIAVYGKNHPKKRIFNQSYADDITFENIKAVYKDRFANAADFEFYIVGDVKKEQLKPLLEQYLSSIPTSGKREKYKDDKASWIADNIQKEVFLKMEDPKASVNMVYKKELPYHKKNAIYTNVLGDMLQLRVTEIIREAEGGAYSPRANASFDKEPRPTAYVSFRFDCNPEMVDKLVEIVKQELRKIVNGTINEEDLNKIRTNFIKEREQAKDSNSYDVLMLTKYYRDHEDITDPKNFENIVRKMSAKDIQKIAKKIMKGKSYQVVFKPEQQN